MIPSVALSDLGAHIYATGGTKARLAFDLLLYTGVRRSDVVRLGPQMERSFAELAPGFGRRRTASSRGVMGRRSCMAAPILHRSKPACKQEGPRSDGDGNGDSSSSFLPRASNLEPRWSFLYTLVIAELAVTIAIFYAFTKTFS